jgi:hypothetical protein
MISWSQGNSLTAAPELLFPVYIIAQKKILAATNTSPVISKTGLDNF